MPRGARLFYSFHHSLTTAAQHQCLILLAPSVLLAAALDTTVLPSSFVTQISRI
jgi:hypothetical protein